MYDSAAIYRIGERAIAWLEKYIREGRPQLAVEPDDMTVFLNPELHRLYQKVDQLSDEDQKALVILLDSLVKRSRVDQVMAER